MSNELGDNSMKPMMSSFKDRRKVEKRKKESLPHEIFQISSRNWNSETNNGVILYV